MPIGVPMPTFETWDIVKVPFPYTDRPVRQRRPALVIAAGDLLSANGLLWVAMITSAENRGWEGDVEIMTPHDAGLPAPSVIRTAKIACIDGRDAERLGSLSSDRERHAVARAIAARLAGLLGEVR
jgi:mRNA interferase MazF